MISYKTDIEERPLTEHEMDENIRESQKSFVIFMLILVGLTLLSCLFSR